MTAREFEEIAGERIRQWIKHSLTFEDGCKRIQDEDDDFDIELDWVFTQKGKDFTHPI